MTYNVVGCQWSESESVCFVQLNAVKFQQQFQQQNSPADVLITH